MEFRRIPIVFSTRPEAIKMAPAIKQLSMNNDFELTVSVSARRILYAHHRFGRRTVKGTLAGQAGIGDARYNRAPKAVAAGTVKLVGVNEDRIFHEASRRLTDQTYYLGNEHGAQSLWRRAGSRAHRRRHPRQCRY